MTTAPVKEFVGARKPAKSKPAPKAPAKKPAKKAPAKKK